MPPELILSRDYQTLLGALKERIRSAQLQALRSVNREQIDLYTDVGRMIITFGLTGRTSYKNGGQCRGTAPRLEGAGAGIQDAPKLAYRHIPLLPKCITDLKA